MGTPSARRRGTRRPPNSTRPSRPRAVKPELKDLDARGVNPPCFPCHRGPPTSTVSAPLGARERAAPYEGLRLRFRRGCRPVSPAQVRPPHRLIHQHPVRWLGREERPLSTPRMVDRSPCDDADGWTALHADALAVLTGWTPTSPDAAVARDRTLGLLDAGPIAMSRAHRAGHVTASALVFDATGSQVLLCLHGKFHKWVQLGGHCEPATGRWPVRRYGRPPRSRASPVCGSIRCRSTWTCTRWPARAGRCTTTYASPFSPRLARRNG